MDPDHREMMQTPMDYLVYLIRINKGFLWQINFIFLTAQIVQWAVENGVIICVENPQFSLFWATTFWQQITHLLEYSVFHLCQYGNSRQKKTMFAFNIAEFHAINTTCRGQNSKHKHAAWGYNRKIKSFATAEETAYPMGLSKMIAMVIVRYLIRLGIQANPETLDAVQPVSLPALQKMRAVAGAQSRSSKIPALVPTYQTCFRLAGCEHNLPRVHLFQRLRNDLTISSNPPQVLPKGSKLLAITPADNLDTGDDRPLQPEVFRLSTSAGDNMPQLLQTWGIPWEPEQFTDEVVKAGALWTWVPSCHRDSKRYWRTTSTKTAMKGTMKNCPQ